MLSNLPMNQLMFTGMFTNMLTHLFMCLFTPMFTLMYTPMFTYITTILKAIMKHMNAIYAYICSCWHTLYVSTFKPMFATRFTDMIKQMFT